jgi:hypothetical protein
MADRKVLHFFPGEHKVIWAINGKAVIVADGWGGEEPQPGVKYDVMKPRPTTPGMYVIYSYEPYRTNTWDLSKIAWGTKLKYDAAADIVYFETGAKPAWKNVADRIPGVDANWIKHTYFALYGKTGKFDSDGDLIPDFWLFNDFGAMAVRYYVDKNKNHKLDKGESLSGEMFHTTPVNEAQVARGLKVTLEPSHGCIHLDPKQRDALHDAGAFDKGTDLFIHKYTDKVPKDLQ